jgi:hypothetical protein
MRSCVTVPGLDSRTAVPGLWFTNKENDSESRPIHRHGRVCFCRKSPPRSQSTGERRRCMALTRRQLYYSNHASRFDFDCGMDERGRDSEVAA